jgi:5-formyltetrahydrofolate cyclo-ligase
MTKDAIRKLYLSKRIALSAAEYHKFNKQMSDNFFKGLDLSEIKVLHTFLPIEKTKEPDTWLIIDRVKKDFPHIQVSIPKINPETSILDHFYYEGPKQLEKNTWGIPEPKQGVPTPIDKIDAVLVPLLGLDKEGHRVGYGRGFYDKFLNACLPDLKKIGLSFFPPISKITDINLTDNRLTHAVTPEKVYSFN